MTDNFSQNSECEFRESFVMIPLNLHEGKWNSKNKTKINNENKNLGDYQKYQLSSYLYGNTMPTDSSRITKKNDVNGGGQLISVVTIDLNSLVIEQSEKFINLMKRYLQYDICFVGVTGKKGCGKSFFCDKAYNLSEIKANNYCKENQAGIFTFSMPFIKGNLCIFLLQIGGCQINSAAYRVLSSVSLILCNQYVYIHEISKEGKNDQQTEFTQFTTILQKTLKAFDFKQNTQIVEDDKTIIQKYLPRRITELSRVNTNQLQNQSYYFSKCKKGYLPNAVTPGYKGSEGDIVHCSFLAKQCINPEYLIKISQTVKQVYNGGEQKKYHELNITGNIVEKLLSAIVVQLNSKKKIKISRIYEDILKQLYVSGYNFCVMEYHDELQNYFADEKPKNQEQMFVVFERTANNALSKFQEFNLNQKIYQQFKKRLQAHIDGKEKLICMINKQKTVEEIQSSFAKQDKKKTESFLEKLKHEKYELEDGRAQAIIPYVVDIYKSGSLGNNQQARIKKVKELISSKSKLLENLTKDTKQKDNQVRRIKKNLEQMKSRKIQLQKQIQKAQKKNQNIMDGTEKVNLGKEKQELRDKLQSKKQLFSNLKAENQDQAIRQLQKSKRQKINNIKVKQKQVEGLIANIEKQNQANKMQSDDKKGKKGQSGKKGQNGKKGQSGKKGGKPK